jgi:hypothetical protein
VIAENNPHCPRCMKKDGTDEGGDCFDPEKESGEAADESRVELDRYHAALSYIFYLLAEFDVGGILGCSRSGSAAYLNNHLIHDFCENRKKPIEQSCFHPAWCVRKCAGLLELVSGIAPATVQKRQRMERPKGSNKKRTIDREKGGGQACLQDDRAVLCCFEGPD